MSSLAWRRRGGPALSLGVGATAMLAVIPGAVNLSIAVGAAGSGVRAAGRILDVGRAGVSWSLDSRICGGAVAVYGRGAAVREEPSFDVRACQACGGAAPRGGRRHECLGHRRTCTWNLRRSSCYSSGPCVVEPDSPFRRKWARIGSGRTRSRLSVAGRRRRCRIRGCVRGLSIIWVARQSWVGWSGSMSEVRGPNRPIARVRMDGSASWMLPPRRWREVERA